MEPDRPNIQIDDLVRPMTDEEYAELISSGWTPDTPPEEGNTPEPWPEPTE